MAQEVDHPDWVKPGAEVVLYTSGNPGAPRNVVKTTIAKVTATTFTVAAEDEPRFRFQSRRFTGPGLDVKQGGTWGWRRIVVPLDSEAARHEMARATRVHRESEARTAVAAWQWNRTRDNRLAAIKAL
ncbi:MAG: hypothetical protein ACREQ5_00465 [Candidatus Dormibacteria bacterium]